MDSKQIQMFYAVTITSVYRLEAKGPYQASAFKVALKGESKIPVSATNLVLSSQMIAITKNLIAYYPEPYGLINPMSGLDRRWENINSFYWGLRTSLIVALFKTEKEAIDCLNQEDKQSADPRWIESTKRVLAEIGEDHPSFYISHSPGCDLLEHKTEK